MHARVFCACTYVSVWAVQLQLILVDETWPKQTTNCVRVRLNQSFPAQLKVGMDLKLRPYRVLATGPTSGFLEYIAADDGV